MTDDALEQDVDAVVEDVVGPPLFPKIIDAPRDVSDRASFVEYPTADFFEGRAMWAANFFVLWPLGLSMIVDVETRPVDPESWCGVERSHGAHGDPGATCAGSEADRETASNLRIRHWSYPEGELEETIEQSDQEDHVDYLVFLGFIRSRLMAMKPEERSRALRRLAQYNIASAENIVIAP